MSYDPKVHKMSFQEYLAQRDDADDGPPAHCVPQTRTPEVFVRRHGRTLPRTGVRHYVK